MKRPERYVPPPVPSLPFLYDHTGQLRTSTGCDRRPETLQVTPVKFTTLLVGSLHAAETTSGLFLHRNNRVVKGVGCPAAILQLCNSLHKPQLQGSHCNANILRFI